MPQIPEEKRAAILADIRTGLKSAGQIARDHGVGKTTVSKMARQAGIDDAFDRTKTAKATYAHAIDARAAREKLKLDLLEDAQRLRDRAWSKYEMVVDNRNTGPQQVTLDLPPLQDVRAAYTALSIAVEKSVRLEQYDSTDNSSDAKSMLGALAEGIRQYAQSPPPDQESAQD